LLVVIAFTYSIISPIINGLACASFFFFYLLWKYLFLWQLDQPRSSETGGLFFPKAIQHMFVGLYLQQICLAALFFLATDQNDHPAAIPEGALMVALIAFTAFFNLIIHNSYGPLLHSLPLSLASRTMPVDGGVDYNRDAEVSANGPETEHIEEKSIASQTGGQRSAAAMDNAVVYSFIDDNPPMLDTGPGTPDVDSSTTHSPPPSIDSEYGSPDLEVAQKHKEKSRAASVHSIRGIDEDSGPKEFYHPASVEPQRVIWLPKDTLGLSEVEVAAIGESGIHVSTEGAEMDAKGHVDIMSEPPG